MVDGAGFVKFRQEYSESLLTPEELAAKKGMYDDPRTLGSLGVDPLTWYNYDQSTPATALPSEEQMLTTWLGRLNFKNIEIQNYLNGVETDWTDLVSKQVSSKTTRPASLTVQTIFPIFGLWDMPIAKVSSW